MDRLSELLAAAANPETRDAECTTHGPFKSRRLLLTAWSKCPACAEARRLEDERKEQERVERERLERHRRFLHEAAIPKRFIGRTFDTYVSDTDAKRAALDTAQEFVENFPANLSSGATLIFSGKPGTGKSHLASAILQALQPRDVRYITCLDMVRAVRNSWRRDSETSETEVLRYFEELDLLVVDEIGMQYGTDGEQTVVFDVIDRRYREMRPLILLTNQGKDGLRQFVGDRSYDRLRETSKWVSFDWDSYRPTARKAGTA
jgi:DNA replication protein DnaC